MYEIIYCHEKKELTGQLRVGLQSIARAWKALTDAREFSTWFRIKLEGDFAAGKKTQGRLTFSGLEHILVEMWVERIEEPRFFSFRWHPRIAL